ncbi:hypothetical protein [Niabella hibiscisoli]|uniref:hypothetical protein n=1 Tax=Niabella hibiscisoli TaxID=1825928 RepID=UPI001F0F1F2B|nr:hypothetical protein [Niabella hibiscisoli]MCH5715086.1 hypothetical protein [Niabella hibiscisoli]
MDFGSQTSGAFWQKAGYGNYPFLIGIQELGTVAERFTKEQKQDLMHIAVCRLLVPSGYYELTATDPDGWPHYKQLKPMPDLNPFEQESFLKDHVLLYFEENEI